LAESAEALSSTPKEAARGWEIPKNFLISPYSATRKDIGRPSVESLLRDKDFAKQNFFLNSAKSCGNLRDEADQARGQPSELYKRSSCLLEADQNRRSNEKTEGRKVSPAREVGCNSGRLNAETNKTASLNTKGGKIWELDPEGSKKRSSSNPEDKKGNSLSIKNGRQNSEANRNSSLNVESNKCGKLISEANKSERQNIEKSKNSKLNTETKHSGRYSEEKNVMHDKLAKDNLKSDSLNYTMKSEHLKAQDQKKEDRAEQPKRRTSRADQKPACVLTYSNKKVFKSSESIDELIDEKEDMKGK
jgi:hypothetical protein